MREGVVEVKKTREGCLMQRFSLGKCKGGDATPKKRVGSSGRGGGS